MNKKKDEEKDMELPDIKDSAKDSVSENADQVILTKINKREEENQALKKILENLNNSTVKTKKNLNK